MLGPVIVTLSGLILLLVTLGILGYYYFIRNISWKDLNVWLKWILVVSGLVGTFFFVFGLTILSYMLIRKLSSPNLRLNGQDMFKYINSSGLENEEKLLQMLQLLTNKIFTLNTDEIIVDKNGIESYIPVELNQKEFETFKVRVSEFVIIYKTNKVKLDDFWEKDQRDRRGEFVNRFLFYLAPSNRFIKYYFQTLIDYIKVEKPDSIRMSQDLTIRSYTQSLYTDMVKYLKERGDNEIPTKEVIEKSIGVLYVGQLNNKLGNNQFRL